MEVVSFRFPIKSNTPAQKPVCTNFGTKAIICLTQSTLLVRIFKGSYFCKTVIADSKGEGIIHPAEIKISTRGFLESRPIADFISHSESCSDDSDPPHGTFLGRTSEGVAAYSNDSSNSLAFGTCRVDSIVTGLPWQCVEFARRCLLQTRNLIFADVPLAANMWNDIDYLTPVSDEKIVPLDSHPNGSQAKPVNGDLLIYSEAFLGTGHIAVVVGCDSEAGVIRVAEQNYSNRPWPGDYSREIPLLEVDGKWWLLEPYLNGWKRVH